MALTDWMYEASPDQGLYSGYTGRYKNKLTGEYNYTAPQEWTDTYNRYLSEGKDAGFASAYTNAEMKGLTNIQQRDIALTPTMTSRLQGYNPESGKWESAMDVGQMHEGTSFGDFALTSALIIGSVYAGGALAGAEMGAAGTTASTGATVAETGGMISTMDAIAGAPLSPAVGLGSAGAGAAAGTEFMGGIGDLAGLDLSGASGVSSGVAPSATASAASGLSGTELLLAAQAAPMLLGLAMDAPEMPNAGSEDSAARPGDTSKPTGMENKDRAMALRRAAAERAANAAGAKRFSNEADLLGHSGRTVARRRAGQQRTVLGY